MGCSFLLTALSIWVYYRIAMRFSRNSTKQLSLFVLLFLCLNVGGVLCLTYCGQAVQAANEHCPLAKRSDHCDRAKQSADPSAESKSVEARAATCCSMPVSFFAAPVENRVIPTFEVVETSVETFTSFAAPLTVKTEQLSTPVYMLPLLDHRSERLLNCVIRI